MSEASIRQHPAREKWNKRFAAGAAPAQDMPSEWLVEHEPLLRAVAGPGRRALDVAAGSGRNALYLAGLGFEVDAIDISDVAIERLRAAARERGLPVNARVVDLEDDGLPAGAYDVVVNMNYLQRDLFGALERAVAPAGLLVFETFGPDHLEALGAGVNPDFVLAPNELLRAFADLRVRRYLEGVVERSGRRKGVESLVAQRPPAADSL
ncbi:MAG: class I SAM-dependent methyltransferase [Solirubrobacteraceae bacterium]